MGMAQTVNRYMVFFNDKNNTPYTVSQPQEYLSIKAIQRNGRIVNTEDLPVTPGYITELKENNVIILGTTKWLNGALVEMIESDLSKVNNLAFVKSIEYVAPGEKPQTGGKPSFEDAQNDVDDLNSTLTQHNMLNSDVMHEDGFFGNGFLIGVFDGGFRGVDQISYFEHIYDNNQITDIYNFVTNGTDIYSYSDHGTRAFSTIAASGSDYEGISTKANFLLYVTEDVRSEYRIEEYNWLIAAERADSTGVDIISSSLGYTDFDDASMDYTHDDLNGKTAVITIAAEKAFERGIIVVTSAGNSGNKAWQKVTPPADGQHVLAIGSVDEFQVKSNFSSIGPINATWIKPDLMAMGQQTVLIGQSGAIATGSGTSFSAPQVASLIAGIWEKYPTLSNIELVDVLKKSADRAGDPDNIYGYGIPSYIGFDNLYQTVTQIASLNVFPNPVLDGNLQIKVKDPNSVEKMDLVIYTTDGKKVMETTRSVSWGNNPIQVSINALSRGIYIVKIITAEQTMMKRIVKP